jgi:CheY-like chemotaxis protein
VPRFLKNVLMADDDPEDCMLAKEAFMESGASAEFSCVEDGMELMDYLLHQVGSKAVPLPDLILLDLNMPRKDGRKALVEIKSEPALLHIPVVVLTTSEEPRDMLFAKGAGAVSFLIKPATFEEWVQIMRNLAENWLS